MPKLVKEISSGTQFSRSSNEGQLADSQNRAYRIILDNPNETIDIQRECQVRIGDQHPYNTNLYCVSFDARFEGDSRMVIAVTFNYQTTAGGTGGAGGADPKSQAPDVRPPTFTTSTSLMEQPLYTWRVREGEEQWGDEGPAVNPAGDIYDGVSRLVPVVTLTARLFQVTDPTVDLQHAGKVNSNQIRIGNLNMKPHTVMFRGVQYEPIVESWGGSLFRGWSASYEFAYKKNETKVRLGGGAGGGADSVVDLGWDIALPQTGFNVKAFDPAGGGVLAEDDEYGQPLRHGGDDDPPEFRGRILEPLALPKGVAAGSKQRAMVSVFSFENGGRSQMPSASPVPLNDDGRPRSDTVNPKVLVYGYAVQPEMDFAQLAGGRNLFQ